MPVKYVLKKTLEKIKSTENTNSGDNDRWYRLKWPCTQIEKMGKQQQLNEAAIAVEMLFYSKNDSASLKTQAKGM